MGYQDLSIGYGTEEISHFLPDDHTRVKVIDSPDFKAAFKDLKAELDRVLEHPIESQPLRDLIRSHYQVGEAKILLIADDNTRPNLHTRLLYPLLTDYLIDRCGVNKEDLGILIASGTHRPPTPQEISGKILGEEFYREFQDQVLFHNDQENLVDLGTSSSGTPITIDQQAIDACLLIPVTDSEYHYFAGVAGTVKQIFPGIAGRITTNTNHTRMFDTETGFKEVCRLGNTTENPVISDMKEMAGLIQEYTPVFCIDAIMDHGEITALNAGDILALHDLANDLLYDRRVIHVDEPGDLVIVAVGKLGINLYQSGKGIHAAWNAARKPGGTILVLAPCPDGVGPDGYRDSMEAVQDFDLERAMEWVIDNKCSLETFRIGNQKPVDTLRILKSLGEGHIKILSEMDPERLRTIYRLDAIPDLGTPQKSLRGFVEDFTSRNPEALVYLLRDPGLKVIPDQG